MVRAGGALLEISQSAAVPRPKSTSGNTQLEQVKVRKKNFPRPGIEPGSGG